MIIIKILVAILLIYVLGFLATPNHVFFTKIKKTEKLRQIAGKFKSKTKEETLRKAYNYVINNFSREEYNFILQFYKLFYTDVEKLLQKKQFVQCTVQNLILITLLVNTGQFKETDFERKWMITHWVVLHQYILVRIENKLFKADPLLRILEWSKV